MMLCWHTVCRLEVCIVERGLFTAALDTVSACTVTIHDEGLGGWTREEYQVAWV
jgi:hypothetical protein